LFRKSKKLQAFKPIPAPNMDFPRYQIYKCKYLRNKRHKENIPRNRHQCYRSSDEDWSWKGISKNSRSEGLSKGDWL